MSADAAQRLMGEAVRCDGLAQQALLRGDAARSRTLFRAAAERYRASWEGAGPDAFGRLIGLLKSSILSGEGGQAAAYVREALGDRCDTPASAYALALAALAQGDDEAALPAVEGMRAGGEAFAQTADALHALAVGDRNAYAKAVTAIVADFAARQEHLTGVAFADTAVMLERLAAPRGVAVRPASAVMPVLG
ncbi:MAG TPA: hypothetical protein VN635_12105 [Conexibacter sp.]|nr:hypothetical protein [Conexibacter sp.]